MALLFDTNGIFALSKIEINILKSLNVNYILGECSSENDLIKYAKDADIIKYFGWASPFTRRVFENLPNLKAIVSHGIGYETIDIEAAKEFKVSVSNTPGYCAEEVSTHAIALLLSYLRNIPFWDNYIRQDRWKGGIKIEYAKGIDTLEGDTIGIVGFGNIGRKIFEKLQSYSVNFIIHDPYAKVTENSLVKVTTLDELLSKSKYIILACSLNKDNNHLIDREQFKMMRNDATLINVSRGMLINEKELIKNLMEKNIKGAALDVFEDEPIKKDNPLLKMENVILTPHLGASSPKAPKLMAKMLFEEIVRLVKGEPLIYRVI